MPKVSPEYDQRQRTAILDAARYCFVQNGFHSTSMDDIIGAAGVSASTVYRHFHSKDEIIYAATEEKFDTIVGMINVLLAQRPLPAPSAVFRQVLQRVTYGLTEPADLQDAAKLILNAWTEAGRNERFRQRVRRAHESLRTAVTTAMGHYQDKGLLRPGLDVEAATDVIWTLAIGLFPREVIFADHAFDRTACLIDRLLLAER